MRESCGKLMFLMFDAIMIMTGDTNECVLQVGDHHPDLHVWNLYNNHEVRAFSSPIFPSCFGPGELHKQGWFLCYFFIVRRFNRSLYALVESRCRAAQPCLSLRRSTAVGNVAEGDNDMVPLKAGREAIGRPSNTVCAPSTSPTG